MGERITVVKQHVTPYGVAETRRQITMPDTPTTEADAKAEAKAQFAAAKRTLEEREERENGKAATHINSVATTDAHVGLHPNDKPKPREMEERKTDLKETLGDPHVRRTPLETEGKGTTDEVTVEPAEARPQGGAGPSVADRAAEAAESAGGKKRGGRRKKK